jgi:hypothetical protein
MTYKEESRKKYSPLRERYELQDNRNFNARNFKNIMEGGSFQPEEEINYKNKDTSSRQQRTSASPLRDARLNMNNKKGVSFAK